MSYDLLRAWMFTSNDILTSRLVTRTPAGFYRAEGLIKNVNTLEEYSNIDKAHILQQSAKTVGHTLMG